MSAILKEKIMIKEVAQTQATPNRLGQVAYWVSQIGSPPLTGAVTALLIGSVLATPPAWVWVLFYIALTILIPCAYITWLVYAGKAVDFHLPLREQRIRPLLLSLLTGLVTWLILYREDAPSLLQMLAAINGVQMALFLIITFYWKISLHCTAATILSALAVVLFGASAVPFTVSVPLIAWSRVYLRRHTLAQTIAGVCLGVGILTPAFYIYLF